MNLLALGELRTNPRAAEVGDLLFVKIGTGIGAGLVSGGRLHRGTNGCAGDIGHVAVAEAENVICRCGNSGCLEAVAGGAAIAREGRRLAETGGSAVMAEMLAASGDISTADVLRAAERGDPAARALLSRAGRLVGGTLATLVSFFNPGLVVLGGGVVLSGDHVLAAVREAVYRRSLPLATRTLRIEFSTIGQAAGLAGAVHLVLDELFAPHRLAQWLPWNSPGRPAGAGHAGRRAHRGVSAAENVTAFVRTPKQERSRASLDRALDAAVALLVERRSGAFTLADVAERAGVSIGSIYGRVESRDDLLRAAHAREMSRIAAAQRQAFAAAAPPEESLADAVARVVGTTGGLLRAEAPVMAPFMLLANSDTVIADAGRATHAGLVEAFRAGLLAHREHIRQPDPERAVTWSCTVVYSVLARWLGLGSDVASAGEGAWDDILGRPHGHGHRVPDRAPWSRGRRGSQEN